MFAFERALLTFCEHRPTEEAELFTALAPLFTMLNRMYERFETQLEIDFAHAILAANEPLDRYALFQRFEGLVCAEATLCSLRPGDTVAMIGSGPLPVTAILLAKRFNLKVKAIERDYRSAALSRRVIAQLGLENQISIFQEDGTTAVPENASCVLIAVLARPKQQILANILRNCADCQTVICRTSEGLRQALYQPTDPSSFREYGLVASNPARGDHTISSLILEVSHNCR